MTFSFIAFLVTAAAVVISGVASFMEGTLTNKNVTMGFLNHGGMWGDLIIMSLVNGFVLPYIARSRFVVFAALFVACVVTIITHTKWAEGMRIDGVTGHMFPTHQAGVWYADLSIAGWMHVLVMAILLTVVLMYAVSPTPANVVLTVSLLLTAHVFVGTVQPGWYCTGELWTWINFGPPICATVLIWIVAALKIQHTKGSF